jgi:NADPH-dependent 2,4-dienoyl-CoA reductase/sulfur reductase-like enzyme
MELLRLGVLVSCGIDVDAELVDAMAPDAATIAVGARLTTPPVPGRDLPHVIGSADYLAHEERSKRESGPCHQPAWLDRAEAVAVVGGSWIGCHVAGLLLARGLQVSIVEGRGELAYDMGDQQGAVLRQRIIDHPGTARIYFDTMVEGIAPDHVSIWQSDVSASRQLAADAVVLVDRRQPNQDLAGAIAQRAGSSVEIFEIGDCVAPRKLQDAMLEGATAAASL